MASIDIPCYNPECDSVDVVILASNPILNNNFKHNLRCNICGTTYDLITCVDSVKIRKENLS